MYFAGSKTAARLLLVTAFFEGVLGLSMHLAPVWFQAPSYASFRPYFSYLSAALVAGAVVLLMLGRHAISPALQRVAVLWAAAPLFAVGILVGKTGPWAAPLVFAGLGLGVLAIPWQHQDFKGRDLFDLVTGGIQAVMGLLMLVTPSAFPTEDNFTLRPFLPVAGAIALAGAAALLIPASPHRRGWKIGRRVCGAVLPSIMAVGSYRSGLPIGMLLFGPIALATLLGRMEYRKDQEREAPRPGTLEHLDRQLEQWSWLLVLAVLLATVVSPAADAQLSHISVSMFAVAMTLYTAVAHWLLPHLGTGEQRIASHLTFLTLAVGLLVGETAPGGHSFLVLLPVPAVLASRALNPATGYRILVLAIVAVLFGHVRDRAFHLTHLEGLAFWSHVAGEELLLVVAGGLGVKRAQEKWELLRDLTAARADLQSQVHQLKTALEAREVAEAARSESERRFRSAFGDAPIGMALAAPDGSWLQVNRSFAAMLGYTESELLKMDVIEITHPDDMELTLRNVTAILTGAAPTCAFEKRYLHRDGHAVWALVTGSAVTDQTGALSYTILHIQDITERKRTELQMTQLANYDTLTGLYNRHRFHLELECELERARRTGVAGALLFLDLDQFKYVNDTRGHQAGDDLLKSVAALLQKHLAPPAMVGRLGGDEFAVLLPRSDESAAQAVADGLLEELRRHQAVVGGQPVTVSASIGIALYPGHGDQSKELLARADLAMYQVKEAGRNGIALYQSDRSDQAFMEAKLTWERRIRGALETDKFVPYFQPILDLRTNEIVHYEMLLRLIDQPGQVVLPAAFLNVAERFGLIHAVDRWVVRRAIHLLAEREAEGSPICLEVNLSGKAFSDPELLPLIRREIAETRINPASLILEITETAAIADTDLARLFIEDLEGLGCRFAIDDFGAGFSSFSYLKQLPVDYLKLDGGFIQNLTCDPVDQHLVKTMVDLARGLGKRTIAEFVGDEATLSLLREYGVDYAQGFYVGEPEPLEALTRKKGTTLR